MSKVTLLASILAVTGCAFCAHADIIVSVDGTAMPWLWDGTSLNTGSQFGIQDGTGPTVVDASSGFSFAAGDTLTITYLDGLTNAFGGSPEVDGNGYGPNAPSPFVFDESDGLGSSSTVLPSFYMDHGTYPIYLNALVGTFADSGGNIVGTPFVINNGPLGVVIPVGASQLQLGINDDIFADNTGSLRVEVDGPSVVSLDAPSAVPEPAAIPVLFAALGMVAFVSWKRRARQASSQQ